MKIQSINPYTEDVMEEFDLLTYDECVTEIAKSRLALSRWKTMRIQERTEYFRNASKILKENKRRYAEIITKEMGKPIRDAIAEVEKCAWICEYYAEQAPPFLQDEKIETEAKKSYVTFDPLGVILGVMPWNFPFWQVFRFAVPTLMAGNTAILKHASNVPRSALLIEEVFTHSKFPPYVFKTLLIDSSTAMKLIEEEKIDGVSLTGSVRAGSQIGTVAGKHIRKIVLELGGSDPFIILEDADIEKAAEIASKARFLNTGQSCIAAKRFIVIESVAHEFQEKFIKYFQALKMGDPLEEDTDLGPVAKKRFVQDLQKQLDDAKERGAEIILGPKPPTGSGFFFQPAVVTDVQLDMRVVSEEVFGPIAPIIWAKDEEEIVKIANSTEFGLGAAIWSRDIERAEKLAKNIEAGVVVINGMVQSDPRLPFGGIKKSGVGRELSYYGIKEFVNIKSISIQE